VLHGLLGVPFEEIAPIVDRTPYRRVARAFLGRAQAAQLILVNGAVGAVVAPRGRLLLALEVTFAHGKIAAISAIRNPDRLRHMELAML
jgi:RNA polymerase sigma-70 factor (ECF subfamily)